MSIEQVVALGAVMSTVVSLGGALIARHRSMPDQEQVDAANRSANEAVRSQEAVVRAAVQAVRDDVEQLRLMSERATADNQLTADEVRQLYAALERVRADLKLAGAPPQGHVTPTASGL